MTYYISYIIQQKFFEGNKFTVSVDSWILHTSASKIISLKFSCNTVVWKYFTIKNFCGYDIHENFLLKNF